MVMEGTIPTGYKYFTPRDTDEIPIGCCFIYGASTWTNCPKCGACLWKFSNGKVAETIRCAECDKTYKIT